MLESVHDECPLSVVFINDNESSILLQMHVFQSLTIMKCHFWARESKPHDCIRVLHPHHHRLGPLSGTIYTCLIYH